jgi:hypothetical protein
VLDDGDQLGRLAEDAAAVAFVHRRRKGLDAGLRVFLLSTCSLPQVAFDQFYSQPPEIHHNTSR